MKLSDAVFGVVIIVASLVMLISARHFPRIPGQAFGPALFPMMVGWGLLGCGILLVIKSLQQHKVLPLLTLPSWTRSPRHVISFFLVPACLVFYIAAVDRLGFLLTAFIALSLLMAWLRRKVLSSIAIALLVTVAIHQLFYKMLMVPLPWGILHSVAR
jgi:putative tricarboxylic transport membrane protein